MNPCMCGDAVWCEDGWSGQRDRFQRVYSERIKLALEGGGTGGVCAGEEERTGDIRTHMFQELPVTWTHSRAL